MLLWGLAQGLAKRSVGEVAPARFCLFYALANAVVSLAFWSSQDAPAVLAAEGRQFAVWGLLAYFLDGSAWIFYYQSIARGPISIVGTLSAAYPALTVIFSRVFLGELLTTAQYAGVAAVIAGCVALAYMPPAPEGARPQRRWMLYAGAAILIWGVSATLIRYAYRFPGAHEANMALFLGVGGLASLGIYGLLFGRGGTRHEWGRAAVPMATMALGSLLAAIAYKYGPASVVTPISGAYPVVTLVFAWIALRERPSRLQWAGIASVLVGMVLTTAGAE